MEENRYEGLNMHDVVIRWRNYCELDSAEYYDANGDTIHDVNKGNMKGKLKLLRESFLLLKNYEKQIEEDFQHTIEIRIDEVRRSLSDPTQQSFYEFIESAFGFIKDYHENKYLISNYLIDEIELDEYQIPIERKTQFVWLLWNEQNALKFIRILEAIKIAKDEQSVSAQDIVNAYQRCNGRDETGKVQCLYDVLGNSGLRLYQEKDKNLNKFFNQMKKS